MKVKYWQQRVGQQQRVDSDVMMSTIGNLSRERLSGLVQTTMTASITSMRNDLKEARLTFISYDQILGHYVNSPCAAESSFPLRLALLYTAHIVQIGVQSIVSSLHKSAISDPKKRVTPNMRSLVKR
jgi:hypothetical protein